MARPEQRSKGLVVDLEKLERHAQNLYLHRFVEHVRKVRGEHGRFLTLRAGDEIAISCAEDESGNVLRAVTIDPDYE